jgi:hypothetical protein
VRVSFALDICALRYAGPTTGSMTHDACAASWWIVSVPISV